MKYLLSMILFLFAQNLSANLMLNELLSNEPGSSTSLEWIELYNNSDTALILSDYTLVVNADSIFLPAHVVYPDSYIIICRKLFSVNNEASFESYWGNGSKVWGDSEFEKTISKPVEASFSLANNSGTVLLLEQQNIISSFNWDETGNDGVSWERKIADSSLILQSKSNSKSTPGVINSVSLMQKDLAVESVSVVIDNFMPYYTFKIANRGKADVGDGILNIYDSTLSMLIQSVTIPMIVSDSGTQLEVSFELSSEQIYEPLVAVVETSSDERSTNDSLYFVAVSQDYPPILISEFLANPQANKETEWIEIYNRSIESIDLQNWFIGDALKVNQITKEQLFIAPNEYLVLTKSTNNFLFEYPQFDGTVIELSDWAILNNESDRIRLIDSYNILADDYSYNSSYDKNYTIACEISNETFMWGRSSDENGTPGFENELFEFHADENVYINLSSKYISPDGDGYEDKVVINIEVPLSESYSLKLYDINGVKVKTFYSENAYIANSIEWDGLGDNNVRLQVGIYILYLTTDNGAGTKETIVIAR